ncbi:MAG: 50S ribosomal protein L23 [Parcubacteria group bacterium GW2011_GWA2_47_8b]|uniref:Large ribosomal subunit protein uL23 n=2 Tax=Candidatus Harrisoniibacteriota TaxID=1817905 RepID=A0A1G1ZVP8_9BACT|nr:MAG: 50S ribosomal protein L23 [Parcubacteria group bacterium GW2011_GWA2_47_8b]KKU93265.1 MAG: 50S ribosomal protein L23 [Parcubacteria group bacterium GW2011_GWA1_48_11b]OGY65055.1 MAG: 50S ribosomal protein L23 [Candidatus Harrisonbacteria bacterium RIFCSPHIGHO2_12_FULL_48_16]OGY68581.1 MAG: 50S ribosomal protein L23 [Candidatus Harrisonbacteria bacterium RIFOXYA1_FULL_48_8]
MNKFVIKHPLISEKATQSSTLGKYVFLVDKKAAAPEIKKALEAIYKVNIMDINVINIPPKPRRTGRYISERPSYKKAVVTLKKGQKLDILPH